MWPKHPNIHDKRLRSFPILKMLRKIILIWCFYIFGFTSYSSAMTAEQLAKIHEQFQILGMECGQDHPISEDDINDLRARKVATGDHVPCFLACVMKKANIMTDDGMLQNEGVKQFFDDAEEQKNVKNFLHSCAHVNSESVSDGDKGCERAVMAYKCMTENAAQFGFDV